MEVREKVFFESKEMEIWESFALFFFFLNFFSNDRGIVTR